MLWSRMVGWPVPARLYYILFEAFIEALKGGNFIGLAHIIVHLVLDQVKSAPVHIASPRIHTQQAISVITNSVKTPSRTSNHART